MRLEVKVAVPNAYVARHNHIPAILIQATISMSKATDNQSNWIVVITTKGSSSLEALKITSQQQTTFFYIFTYEQIFQYLRMKFFA